MMMYSIYKLSLCLVSLFSGMVINVQECMQLNENPDNERWLYNIFNNSMGDNTPETMHIDVYLTELNRTDDKIQITVPTYRFKNDVTGNFLRQLNDSIAKYDQLPWRIIQPAQDEAVERGAIYSEHMRLESFNDIKGVILGPKPNHATAIYSDSPSWLNKMQIESTGSNTIIHIQPTMLAVEGIWPTECYFNVENSGRVNIHLILYGNDRMDINKYAESRPEFIKRFLWIRDYYKTHGFSTKLEFLDE